MNIIEKIVEAFVPKSYDTINFDWDKGRLVCVTYLKQTVVLYTLTLVYDTNGNLKHIVKTGG